MVIEEQHWWSFSLKEVWEIFAMPPSNFNHDESASNHPHGGYITRYYDITH